MTKEKKPRLFYYADAFDCWIPAPLRVDHIVFLDDFIGCGDETDIRFRRVDLTDEEYENLADAEDPTPWCHRCGSMTQAGCHCGPIARND